MGICLGHQLIARATGHETYKLPFGHRGANHPVHERLTGRVLVTSQNHGFAVAASEAAEVSHVSLYDGTVEGLDLPGPARPLAPVPSRGGPGAARRVAPARGLGRGGRRMPRRNDIESICIVGSGPIVIGQAAEFDYAGCQALKVLREDGFRTIVVNSNPATIMTDPGFADRTYLEPLDAESVAEVLRIERPDALLPTMGGQTALNLARELANAGVLDELGIELIGARLDAIERAEDRLKFKEAVESCGLKVPTSAIVTSLDELDGADGAGRRAARLHARRPRRRVRLHRGGAVPPGRARPRGVPDRPGAGRGVGARLGRVRARGRPRPDRQRRHRLLDREPRPDGRPHGRLGHRRAADDAARRGVPGAARRGGGRHPRGRRRHRRLEHPVRAQPRDRRRARDRDEPARLALVRARVEGDRLPDREGRRAARRRLHARRDPERPDGDDARRASSRRSTTSSSSSRASRSRSSPAPTGRSARR